MIRLSNGSVTALSGGVTQPNYDRIAQAHGIVHLGIGAFHRAHQAVMTDDAMNIGDRHWGIIGVSLRSPAVADQLNPQDGLYTVASRHAGGEDVRLIGAVQRVLVGAQDAVAIAAAIAAPTCHIISLTVTEKGYCRASDGTLDLASAGRGSIYPVIAAGLAARRDAGLLGLTILSCDNLANNGAVLGACLDQYIEAHARDLLPWFRAECTTPATMIDRIVPATTGADRAAMAVRLGLRDEAMVATEPFTQWVIEDHFAGPRPRWESGGAQLVSDVASYETAKLRLLNGAHSALAYIGLSAGHAYVHQAIADPAIRPLIDQLMLAEAAPSIAAAPGQDLAAYAAQLVDRFANPALHHRLAQIAMDGSQKIPQRWLETLAWNQAHGRDCPALLTAVAAWLRHVRGDNIQHTGGPVDDPRADWLARQWEIAGRDGFVRALFGPDRPLGAWVASEADAAFMTALI